MVSQTWYLALAAFVFSCGLYAALTRRNAIAVLIGIELMLNAVNINLVTFWRYGSMAPMEQLSGQVFSLFVIAIAGAEAAVGLALIISVYRTRHTVNLDELDVLKG